MSSVSFQVVSWGVVESNGKSRRKYHLQSDLGLRLDAVLAKIKELSEASLPKTDWDLPFLRVALGAKQLVVANRVQHFQHGRFVGLDVEASSLKLDQD